MRISEAVCALSQCIHMECLQCDQLIQVLLKQDVSTMLASYDSPLKTSGAGIDTVDMYSSFILL